MSKYFRSPSAYMSNWFNRLARRQAREDNKHGVVSEIEKEKEFMDITTSEKYMVGHFFHKDFRRCKIMDTHLEVSDLFPRSLVY